MQKQLWKLAIQGMKKRKRNSLLLFCVLVIAFSFSIVGLSLVESMNISNREYRFNHYGTWHTAVFQGKKEDISVYRKEKEMEIGTLTCFGKLETGAGIGTVDQELIEMGRIGLQKGRFPEKTGEAAMEANVLSRLGYSYELGQEIPLKIFVDEIELEGLPDEAVLIEKTVTLCGVIRSYSNLWQAEMHTLPGVFVTDQAEQQIREEARKDVKRGLKELETMYFFKTAGGQEETAAAVQNRKEELNGSDKGERWVVNNTQAYQDIETAVYPYLYLSIIFVTTGIAVICIYSVRIRKQVQQIALFRSIGITRKQIRMMIFYETISLTLPAIVLGFVCGCAETWLALRLFMGVQEKIIIQVPYRALGTLFFLLVLEIVLVRMVVIQIALRQPLTGKMAMNGRKIRRHKWLHRILYVVLAVVICTVSFFSVLQSTQIYGAKKSFGRLPDYRFRVVSWDNKKVSDQDLREIQEIPGIEELHAWGYIRVKMKFPNMETCELSKTLMPEFSSDMEEEEGITCSLYGIREEDWDYYLDFERWSLNREAFRKGEEMLMLFLGNTFGDVLVNKEIPRDEKLQNEIPSDSSPLPVVETYQDVGIQKGDVISCDIYGRAIEEDPFGNLSPKEKSEKTVTFQTKVGEVRKIVDNELTDPLQLFASAGPYTILCSADALADLLGKVPGRKCVETYDTGQEFGYTQGEIYASQQAGFLSTDVIVADIFGEKHISMDNVREDNAVIQQDLQNRLILYTAGGGTVLIIAFLMLWNLLSLDTEEEKKKTGILMAIGLSEKQIRNRIFVRALVLGVISALAGFLFFGGYLYLYSWLNIRVGEILFQESGKTILERLMDQVESYRVVGIRFWHLLLLGLLSGGSIGLVYYITKIKLRKADVSKLIREE